MNTGAFGQHLTLMEKLKAGTEAAHRRLESAPFFSALADCQLPLESYLGQLRALAVIYGVLEQVLASCADPRIGSVWNREMLKLPLLENDLRFFASRTVPDLKEALDVALKAAEQIRFLSVEYPLALLGYVYVLEGSTLGATVLRPLIARAFLLTGAEGLAYLQNYGPEVRASWAQFQQRMNQLCLSAEERGQIVKAAGDFFQRLDSVFRALYPFPPESKACFVLTINPEAGRHAVPADSREVEAAIRAGDICWERYPYYEQRYGERGRRFSRSDAAWQATLYHFEPAHISQQVRWLGRVLAGRGMPTFLLADQLVILVEELAAAIPENRSAYERLLPAAAELRESRRRRLTDAQIRAIDTGFDRAVGPEWTARLPHTGTLLGCAVADELEGSELAVESLRQWMTDATRFPAGWIAAVESTLAQARVQARRTATSIVKLPRTHEQESDGSC
jgi:heme oxygenase